MEKNIGYQMAEFAVNTKYGDIPKEILQFAKCLTLKTVAGMLAGSATPSARTVAGILKEKKLPKEVGVIGSDLKTSLWEAVLLSAYFAHAKELEDDRYVQAEGVSWDITVIPLLLPLAEKLGLSGKTLLEALVVGLEVHARTCMSGTQHLGLFVLPGAIGPAVGAARALGLGVKETASSIGLSMSGVPLAMANFGTDAHFFESALQSLQGIMAAELAQRGLNGNSDLATYLTSHLGKDKVVPGRLVENLGKRWVFQEIQVKKYPCCLANHRQVDLVIEMRKEHNLSFDDVEVIEMHSRRKGDYRNDRPDPKTEGDLQFSFQHNLGTAMLYGDLGVEHYSAEAVLDPKLREARAKVKFIPAPEDAPEDSVDLPACVVIKTKDGRRFSKERKYAIGSFQEPLTVEQFRGLYQKFARGVLSEKRIAKTADLILNLEELPAAKDLNKLLYRRV